uniref:Putative secreted protein n=2 Tax=Anopheles triannulatus TaxID=58253 RepID=A0A2M4AVM7_9DIPT
MLLLMLLMLLLLVMIVIMMLADAMTRAPMLSTSVVLLLDNVIHRMILGLLLDRLQRLLVDDVMLLRNDVMLDQLRLMMQMMMLRLRLMLRNDLLLMQLLVRMSEMMVSGINNVNADRRWSRLD